MWFILLLCEGVNSSLSWLLKRGLIPLCFHFKFIFHTRVALNSDITPDTQACIVMSFAVLQERVNFGGIDSV